MESNPINPMPSDTNIASIGNLIVAPNNTPQIGGIAPITNAIGTTVRSNDIVLIQK